MVKGRKWKPLGLLVKTYKESSNPKKDELINELIDKLKLPVGANRSGQ